MSSDETNGDDWQMIDVILQSRDALDSRSSMGSQLTWRHLNKLNKKLLVLLLLR